MCRWPVDRFFQFLLKDAQEGDIVAPYGTVNYGLASFRVTAIRPLDDGKFEIEYRVKVQMELPRTRREVRAGSDAIMIKRACLCQKPVCDLHLRRVDDAVVYCLNHWQAWESVA